MSLQSELPMNPLLMCALSLSPLTHELIKSLEKGKTEKMRKEEGGEEPRMPKDENWVRKLYVCVLVCACVCEKEREMKEKIKHRIRDLNPTEVNDRLKCKIIKRNRRIIKTFYEWLFWEHLVSARSNIKIKLTPLIYGEKTWKMQQK